MNVIAMIVFKNEFYSSFHLSDISCDFVHKLQVTKDKINYLIGCQYNGIIFPGLLI